MEDEKDCPEWAVNLKMRLVRVESDVAWLKKGYWLQVSFGIATFITVLGLILKLVEVI